uniref:Digalactosyldiacylglycerol synthase 2, chloroplastic n=1 Tax=Musa acuminata subsp. malaccensis TaxID=214687 RepID=A0A804KFI7_MUSAM|nr:PREDICTED: digalactosyldiacylglycerol synthase 2, chloroplastic-like isoform X3 [Musa acuminata subsp. malaccensis]
MARKQHIAIFTTASLPWMTGTAVNPLFRAAYLAKNHEREVTLVIPWLSLKDQTLVYPNKITFCSLEEHEAYVYWWLKEKADILSEFRIAFYPGKVVRLSAATQDLPRSIICNVHGVNPKFLEVGITRHQLKQGAQTAFSKGVYFIGKMIWSKGYTELLQLLSEHQNEFSDLQVDLHGNGEDFDEIQDSFSKLTLDVRIYSGRDHVDPLFHKYKVFVNPSTTDVVCTTTAEALAMGKIVICASHPSNEFFKQFPNCHMYNTSHEFVKLTLEALAEQPVPLTDDLRHALSWEAATERFVEAAELNEVFQEKALPSAKPFMLMSSDYWMKRLVEASAYLHNTVSGIEAARCAFGAIPQTLLPDEQLWKELGLGFPEQKQCFRR